MVDRLYLDITKEIREVHIIVTDAQQKVIQKQAELLGMQTPDEVIQLIGDQVRDAIQPVMLKLITERLPDIVAEQIEFMASHGRQKIRRHLSTAERIADVIVMMDQKGDTGADGTAPARPGP